MLQIFSKNKVPASAHQILTSNPSTGIENLRYSVEEIKFNKRF